METKAWDMFNREIHIDDSVQIIIDYSPVEGIVSRICANGYVKVD